MASDLARTSWRGMAVDHPADWELVVASGPDEPGRLTFADRIHERLDVRWKRLTYVPDMGKALEKYRRNPEGKSRLTDLAPAPEPWQGVVRHLSKGSLVHAGRFFRSIRWLVEVTLVWPGPRDEALQGRILSSAAAADPQDAVRHWQASGIDLDLGRDFDLQVNQARVGRVSWTFRTAGKRPGELVVERLALPDYWLKTPLREWLGEQTPDAHEVVRQDLAPCGAHRGESLITRGRVSTMSTLRGLREIRLDVAWPCPKEGRIYHVVRKDISRDQEISLPPTLRVRCCGAVPMARPGEVDG